ncbi:MAG TPA: M48 family metallopeptidase [Burkholderiaceae bacterium]|nr:M48 family metallopeptidase [Burkholderiaceae bacterium]
MSGTAPPTLSARFHDGRSARPQAVDLQIDATGLVLRGEALERRYDWASAQVLERLQHAPRVIRFADGAFCEVADQATLDALLATAGHRDSWVARSQRRWGAVLGATALLLATLFALYRWGLPLAADRIARSIPPAVEARVGAQATRFVEQQFGPSKSSGPQADRAWHVFDSIVPPDGRDFRLVLRDGGSIGANAFALPGGTVVVTDQLLELAPGDAALAGVLAHEIGHVEHRHLMRQLISGTMVGAVTTLLAGDTSSVMVALPAVLADLSYSRDMEREADAYAVDLLKRKAIPIGPFADLLQQLQTAHGSRGDPGWARYLQTHPDTGDRVAAIRAAQDR